MTAVNVPKNDYKIICRCCLSVGNFKDINSTHNWIDKDEVYTQMILECFNIELIPLDQKSGMSAICGICITQLRTAHRFRQQVIRSEHSLFDVISKTIDVKPESKDYITVKYEPEEENCNKIDDYNGDSDFGSQEFNDDPPEDTIKPLKKKRKSKVQKITIKKIKSENNKKKTSINIRQYTIMNANTILQNSNALLFKWNSVNGFACFFCNTLFTDTKLLLNHTKTHTAKNLEILIRKQYRVTLIKADISDLQCRLCSSPTPDLNVLKEHLIKVHQKQFMDCPDCVVPYRLPSNNDFKCQICDASFIHFVLLNMHMISHYSNSVCEICGAKFTSKSRLSTHIQGSHGEKDFKCTHCSKSFRTKVVLNVHIRNTHLGNKQKFKCSCGEVFNSYVLKRRHAVLVHKADHLKIDCDYCKLTFIRKSALNKHMRRIHLGEKTIPCPECAKLFFSQGEVTEHMVTHTKERNFECTVCEKAFARKYVLSQHMRVHNEDRRFVCNQCGEAFDQKCSLKHHITKYHSHIQLRI